MTIVVGYTTKPEGRAALERAIVEAKTHGESVVVLNVSDGDGMRDPLLASEDDLNEVRAHLAHAGVEGTVRQLVRGKDAAEEIEAVSEEVGASLIVIGLRKRTPVGKLVLGSNSQRILLNATAPVLAVKAARERQGRKGRRRGLPRHRPGRPDRRPCARPRRPASEAAGRRSAQRLVASSRSPAASATTSRVGLVLGEEVLGVGGAVLLDVEDALALGHDDRHEHLAGDVHRGAAHVEDRVDGQQQAHALERQAEGRQRQGEHDRRAGQARGGGGADDGDERDEQVVRDAEVHAEELRDEDRGDGRVDRGAAVHLGRRAERHGEGGVGARHAEVAVGHPLGHRHGADRGAGDEGQLDGRPGAAEVAHDRQAVRLEQHRVDHEEHQGQADVDRDGEGAEVGQRGPAVGGDGAADEADGAERRQADDPPQHLLDDGEHRGVEGRGTGRPSCRP